MKRSTSQLLFLVSHPLWQEPDQCHGVKFLLNRVMGTPADQLTILRRIMSNDGENVYKLFLLVIRETV